MREREYKEFYERVGRSNGWNFSKMKCVVEGAEWDFYQEVRCRCKSSDVLLDIGTGGGEALLSMAESVQAAVGIDNAAGMIETAQANLRAAKTVSYMRFVQMDAEKLDFADAYFNIVSCRHAPFNASEAARVLSNGGLFLTQQVSEGDKLNLKQAFGRGQAFGVPDGTLMSQYRSQLEAAGFRSIQTLAFNADEYYESYEDLVFLLKHTPIIPNFGDAESDFAILDAFIQENSSIKGIRTNAKRFMIIAEK